MIPALHLLTDVHPLEFLMQYKTSGDDILFIQFREPDFIFVGINEC